MLCIWSIAYIRNTYKPILPCDCINAIIQCDTPCNADNISLQKCEHMCKSKFMYVNRFDYRTSGTTATYNIVFWIARWLGYLFNSL